MKVTICTGMKGEAKGIRREFELPEYPEIELRAYMDLDGKVITRLTCIGRIHGGPVPKGYRNAIARYAQTYIHEGTVA